MGSFSICSGGGKYSAVPPVVGRSMEVFGAGCLNRRLRIPKSVVAEPSRLPEQQVLAGYPIATIDSKMLSLNK